MHPPPTHSACRHLAHNRLTGDLPASLPCAFPMLLMLDARHNDLQGSLPPEWWDEHARGLRHLQFL